MNDASDRLPRDPVRPLKDASGDDPRLSKLLETVSRIEPAPVDVDRGWPDVLARAARSGEPVKPLRVVPATDPRTAELV